MVDLLAAAVFLFSHSQRKKLANRQTFCSRNHKILSCLMHYFSLKNWTFIVPLWFFRCLQEDYYG